MIHSNNSSVTDATGKPDSADLITAPDALTQILREGAQKMLKAAIEREVADYVEERKDIVGQDGRRLVVRNGTLPGREIVTGLGAVAVSQPRVTNTPVGKRVDAVPEVSAESIQFPDNDGLHVPVEHSRLQPFELRTFKVFPGRRIHEPLRLVGRDIVSIKPALDLSFLAGDILTDARNPDVDSPFHIAPSCVSLGVPNLAHLLAEKTLFI